MKLLDLRKLGCAVAAAGLLAALPGSALAQDLKNSINLGVGFVPPFGDTTGSVIMVEYERLITRTLSVYGRGSFLKYKFDDDTNEETGKGTGVGLGVRFFPQGGMKGFYVGGGIAHFRSTWDWKDDKGTSFRTEGNGKSSSFQWGGEVGYRFSFSSGRVSLTPALNVGSWLGADTTCNQTFPTKQTCNKDSEVGFYTAVSVALGFAF